MFLAASANAGAASIIPAAQRNDVAAWFRAPPCTPAAQTPELPVAPEKR